MEFRKQTYGINFPFLDSSKGDFLQLTEIPETEIKSNLIHLLLTRKGSRYFMPDFGTNLYQYIFEPLDEMVMGKIEDEIIDACEKYLPNLKIDKIDIRNLMDDPEASAEQVHKIIINIDYTINSRTFQSTDSISLFF